VSTQMIFTPASSAAAAAPRPTGPATGMMMSAPWAMNCSVSRWPLSWFSKSPVKAPFWAALSQPRTSTAVPLSSLYFATPSAKPSMKMATVGICMPPKVATLPVSVIPAAT